MAEKIIKLKEDASDNSKLINTYYKDVMNFAMINDPSDEIDSIVININP